MRNYFTVMGATLTASAGAAAAEPLHVWLTKPDFPVAVSMLRDRVDVPVRLTVGKDGSLRCVPANLKKHPELRRPSCDILVSRWAFAPRFDREGRAVPTRFDLLMQWRPDMSDMELDGALPVSPENWVKQEDYLMPRVTVGKTTVVFTITLEGRVSDCKIVESARTLALDEAVCPALRKRAIFLPPLDELGARRAASGRFTRHWPW